MNWPSDRRILASVIVACAFAVFVVRTMMQPQYTPCDFAVVWTEARSWLIGANPYDRTTALGYWVGAGGNSEIMPVPSPGAARVWLPILGMPPIMPLLAPLAMLPAPVAVNVWYMIAAALLLAQTAALASMIGSTLVRPLGLILLAVTLVFAPIHECFGYANPSGPSISLIILALWGLTTNRGIFAGVCLAVASVLKPQLGGVFVLLFIFTGRWRAFTTSAIIFGALLAIAIIPMTIRDTPWLAGWLENYSYGDSPGGINSTSIENPRRIHLLNLQVIFNGIVDNRVAVNVLAMLTTAILAAVLIWRRRRSTQPDELLFISAVCVIALLPVYHRFYDAALMLVPIAWAIANLRTRPRTAWLVLAFAATFIVPAPAVLRAAQFLAINPETASGWFWNVVIEPARSWLLLGGLACMIGAIRVSNEAAAPHISPLRSDSMRSPVARRVAAGSGGGAR